MLLIYCVHGRDLAALSTPCARFKCTIEMRQTNVCNLSGFVQDARGVYLIRTVLWNTEILIS